MKMSSSTSEEFEERFEAQKEFKPPEDSSVSNIDPRNSLNDLSGKEWLKFTKSWFIEDGKPSEITREIDLHPASFPPPMIAEFIRFFTKKNGQVLDPFLGTGSTLVACEATKRRGVGIELYQKYAQTAKSRTRFPVWVGDARTVLPRLKEEGFLFDLCITSPPYWSMLKKIDHTQRARMAKGLETQYGEDQRDLGTIHDYVEFLSEIANTFRLVAEVLKPGKHLVVIAQNIRDKGRTRPFAFDLVKELEDCYTFLGEKIWCQNQKTLRPYGYPFAFVTSVHHHYCLVFRKPK